MTTDSLRMLTRPGYRGELNDTILSRVRELAEQLSIPDLESKFAHLHATDGSWRRAAVDSIRHNESDLHVSAFIDHTELRPDAAPLRIDALCKEAIQFGFASVMVNGCHVSRAVCNLRGTAVRVGATVGFPLGQTTTAMKVAEAQEAVQLGAREVDMVINVSALQAGMAEYVYHEVSAVCAAVCARGALVKVILEICLLSQREIIDGCILCVAAGAAFVKTSTGFSSAGATPESVDVMLAVVGNSALVKVSGGVRDGDTARQYVQAGVRRIGTSSGGTMSWRERLSETLPASRLPGSERFVTRRYLRPPDAETSHDDTASTTTTVTDTCDTWRRFTQAVPSGSNAHGATAVTMDVVSSAPTLLPQSAMQKKSSEGTSVESVPLLHRGGMSDISTPVGVPQNIWQRPELSVPSSSQNEARSTAHVSTPSETAQQPEPFAARQSMHAEAQRQQPLDGRDARQPRPSCAQGAMEQCTAVSVTFPLARLRALVRDGETFAQVMHTAGSSTQTFDFMDVVGRWRACATVLRDKTVNKDSATDDIHGPRSEKTSSSVAAAAAAIAANANKINDEDTSSADGMNCGPNGDGTVDDLAAASATSRQDRAPNTPQRTHAAILCDALLDAVSLEHLTIASAVERLLRERMTHEREVAGLREALVRAQKLATRRLAEMTADHASEMCRLRCRVEELEELQQKPRQEIAVAAVSTHAHTAGRGFMSNEGDTESMPHERGAQAAAAQTAAAAAADYSAECASATLPTHVDSMPNLSAHLGPDGCDACDAPCFSSSMSSPEPHTQHAIMGTMNAPSRLMNRHTHADDATMAHVTLDACDTFDDTHEEVRRRHTNVRSSSATQTELSLDYILAAVGAERDRTFRSTRRERENDLIALLVREVEGMRVQLTVAHAQLSTLEEQRHHFLGSVSSPLSFAERAAITHAAHAW